jgi:hypothetical protein
MKSCAAPDRRMLKERAEYFFSTRVKRRGEVADFARALSELGEVVVIGGCLRDLLLRAVGPSRPTSTSWSIQDQ